MANPFGMGLPNQGLHALTSSFVSSVTQTAPVEYDADSSANLTIGAERDLVALKTVAANQKITLDSIVVNVPIADAIVRLYRNGVIVEAWTPKTVGQSVELFPVGCGKEIDETETWKITAISATGIAAKAHISVSGRTEMKRNELFTQVIA